ncbi:hypothetical protein B296_00023600 [Ensete ventricosum]|uniref:Uncharacterized protein n=1 Tax=Ensete ventricosum TaxID=4639 RepID=A0A427AW98_ENSVE|nr:hypothetical protein B296_00023600 [Ensete ventricosum]
MSAARLERHRPDRPPRVLGGPLDPIPATIVEAAGGPPAFRTPTRLDPRRRCSHLLLRHVSCHGPQLLRALHKGGDR